jgi:glycosyltransferase involved in cell wall biosynthesis
MSKHIFFIASTGKWWDHRYYFKQMPALADAGHRVSYLVTTDGEKVSAEHGIRLIPMAMNTARWARVLGGINLYRKVVKEAPDAIQLCNVELLPLGVLIAMTTGIRVFYDCREDHFNAMMHHKPWFPKWKRYAMAYGVRSVEYLADKLFHGIVTSDPAIYRIHAPMPADRRMIYYNMALKKQFSQVPLKPLDQRKYDLVVLGSMSIRTGVYTVIEALGILRSQGWQLTLKLIGDPSIDKELLHKMQAQMANDGTTEQVTITGRRPYGEIPYELSDCKVGVIPLLRFAKFENNIATKQFEYMMSGIPIISSDLPPQCFFIKEGFNGLFYPPGDAGKLAEAIVRLMDDPALASEFGRNALMKVTDEWNAEFQQQKYVEFMNARLEGRPYVESQLPQHIQWKSLA